MTLTEYNDAVDELADRLYRFVLKSLGNEDLARDVVQDSFEKLWQHHANVETLKVKSYLFTTAYHALIDCLRREKRGVLSSMDSLPELPVEDNYSDLQEVLHNALLRLPGHFRTVVLLRDYEGYSYREISQMTDLTEAQVKINIYRARVALRKYIGTLEAVI